MNVVIIGSLQQFDDMLKLRMVLEEQGHSVIVPNPDDNRDLVLIDLEWLSIMDQADQIMVIPKEWEVNEDGKSFSVKFGESTSYKIAYAQHIGKELRVIVPRNGVEGDQNG